MVTDSPARPERDALFVVSVESGEKRQLTSPQGRPGADNDPAVSPDGKWLVFRRDAAPFTGELYRVPLGKDLAVTGEPVRLTPTELTAYNPRWMPDSAEILFAAREARCGGCESPGRGAETAAVCQARMVCSRQSSRTQPGQPTRLVYVRSFRDANIWRVETPGAQGAATASPPRSNLVHATGHLARAIARRAVEVTFMSDRSGEIRGLGCGHDRRERDSAHVMGADSGIPALVP